MITSNKKTIKFVKFFKSSHLALRLTADSLFNEIEDLKTETVVIDFSSIHFISRSFAHQYLRRKNDSKKQISEVNMNTSVQEMLRMVLSNKTRSILPDLSNVRIVSFATVAGQ